MKLYGAWRLSLVICISHNHYRQALLKLVQIGRIAETLSKILYFLSRVFLV